MLWLKDLKQALQAADNAEARADVLKTPVAVPLVGKWRCKQVSEDTETEGLWATFRVTDSGVDREGDIILSAGMDTAHYESNGSLLWGHRADRPDFVLGAPVDVQRSETAIDITFRFATPAENPMGAMVGRMVQSGLVSGTSVGILVREYTEAADRGGFMPLNILASELLEVSVTPIPANPRAVLRAPVGETKETIDHTAPVESTDAVIRAWQTAAELYHARSVAALDPMVAAFIRAIGRN